jgi:hypothetical protein
MLKRLWTGDISLPISFWLFGVLFSLIFIIISFRLGMFLPEDFRVPTILGSWLIYGLLVNIIIWRSSAKRSSSKIWKYLARISMITAWFIFLSLAFVLFFVVMDLSTTSYTIEKQLEPNPTMPYIGFWKFNCSDKFGVVLQSAENEYYYIRFCGPGGCFRKTSFARTNFIDDPYYKIIDSDTIGYDVEKLLGNKMWMTSLGPEEKEWLEQNMKDGLIIFKRCK